MIPYDPTASGITSHHRTIPIPTWYSLAMDKPGSQAEKATLTHGRRGDLVAQLALALKVIDALLETQGKRFVRLPDDHTLLRGLASIKHDRAEYDVRRES